MELARRRGVVSLTPSPTVPPSAARTIGSKGNQVAATECAPRKRRRDERRSLLALLSRDLLSDGRLE